MIVAGSHSRSSGNSPNSFCVSFVELTVTLGGLWESGQRTGRSQVQRHPGFHRTAMFEHPNPHPSFSQNFNSRRRRCHFPPGPPLPPAAASCNVLHTNPKRFPVGRETFVRPSKGSWTCLMIKHCFDPWLWRALQYMNCCKSLSAHNLYKSSHPYRHTHARADPHWHTARMKMTRGEKMDCTSG